MRAIRQLLPLLLLGLALQSARAFSLLGPFEPWMTTNLGFINNFNDGVDIGGPKNIGEGYRWNVPVITYGFDESFLDYFGSNGVAAVESAIQIFNSLPPALATNLNGYLLDTTWMNYPAAELSLYDLKSSALALILEQLGLASPTRFVYVLTNYTDMFNYTVIMRNFDPVTLEPSAYVNGILYASSFREYDQVTISGNLPEDPEQQYSDYNAVADYTFSFYSVGLYFGQYYRGLTRDDVGGLSYLYGTNNFAVESLIPGVRGAGRDARIFVNRALRPGVGKITFQRLDFDERHHRFVPMTLRYVDSYLPNNTLQHQTLEREIAQPDILFTAQSLGFNEYSRTGTSNWVNNGAPSQYGPGVIRPPVAINFGRVGPYIVHNGTQYSNPVDIYVDPNAWASFDNTTNIPIIYPADSTRNNSTVIYFKLYAFPSTEITASHDTAWRLTGQHDEVFLLQTSTNLSDWFTITTLTNNAQDVDYIDQVSPNTPQRFFRVTPQ